LRGEQVPKLIGFRNFLAIRRIRVEVSPRFAESWVLLTEATRKTVGNYTARRDPPHFQGDEYHAHAKVGGGYEIAWGVSGARRHEHKFPQVIPRDAKQAIANVLGVDVNILETFVVHGEGENADIFLVEVSEEE
jgi:hypothetical protein